MLNKKQRKSMENMEECHKIVQQSSVRGINATYVAEKMKVDRTTVYSYLNSLMYMGRVENRNGLWYAKTVKSTDQTGEKEIVIELPVQEKEWRRLALIEAKAKDWEEKHPQKADSGYKILLAKYNETRIIRIKGKNVDDLDLEKVGNLIQKANEKSAKFNLKSFFKKLRKS